MYRFRAALPLLVIAVTALAGACSNEPPALTPTPLPLPLPQPPVSRGALVELAVSGPPRLTLGASGKYTAIARFSNGVVEDATDRVRWGSSLYPPFLASMSSDGTATALTTRGWGHVSASLEHINAYLNVTVAEDGVFTLGGSIRDDGTGQPIRDAVVEAVDASGARQAVATDIGDIDFPYFLFLAQGTATLHIRSGGYVSSTQTVEIASSGFKDFRLVRAR